VTHARCEVCRREGAQRDYASADGRPRGELCLNCALAVAQVEARIVTFRRVLAYVKRYAPLTPGRPVAKLKGDAENTPR
jgi:hypothetical protein